jgi:Holliday junction resolvasome RuvABC endonuclease subunit
MGPDVAHADEALESGKRRLVMIYVGIDPGSNGGIAALDAPGNVVLTAKIPETAVGILDVLRSVTQLGPTRAVLEHVHTMPKQGIVSAFTFGQGFGALRMALAATEIPYDLVVPRKWQALLSIGVTHGDKNITKRRAQELFPSVKVTHAIADALLIAEACRRWHSVKGTP